MSLYGLIGEKLGHSLSPKIHSSIFDSLNIEGHYHLFEVDKGYLKAAVEGLKALKVKGVNVTIPYKIEIMDFLDEISEEAKKIGAVNTLCLRNKKIIGYNTDYYGFGMMLNKFSVDVKGKHAVILGTGGASKAVVQYLKDEGIGHITLVARDLEKGKNNFPKEEIIAYNDIEKIGKAYLIINCTPVGMYPKINNSPVNREIFNNFDVAVDLIYNPLETLFLRNAREEGCKCINGFYMLIGQAIKAQELWNNVKIDEKLLSEIYEKMKEEI